MHSARAYFTGYMKAGGRSVQSNWEKLQLKRPLKGLQQLLQFRQQQLNLFASRLLTTIDLPHLHETQVYT